jgi:hypothetical protein
MSFYRKQQATMSDPVIGHRRFVDGTNRPIYLDERGQYVLDDCEPIYGIWLLPEEDACDLPLIVDRLPELWRTFLSE